MKVEHLDEVVKITIEEEAEWARSEFPHPLVTLDYDSNNRLIAVSAVNKNGETKGPAPVQFLFGVDDPFENDGMYVWLVEEDYYKKNGYVDDSSTVHSAISLRKFESIDQQEDFELQVVSWLDRATHGILYGEGMESAWEAEVKEDETWEQAVERVKSGLIERGFKHEPKLDRQ